MTTDYDKKHQMIDEVRGLLGSEFPDQIEITPQMIEAGVDVLRQRCYGNDVSCLVVDVYRAMMIARRQEGT